MTSFESKLLHGQQMKDLASLGTPFLRTFLESNSKTKLYLIDHYAEGFGYGRLDESLEGSSHRRSFVRTAPESHRVDFEGDSSILPNKAWVWAKQNNPTNAYCQAYDQDLRAWGHVFWDNERLSGTSLLDETRPNVSWPYYDRSSFSSKLRCEQTPSAEQRLKDTGLVLSCRERPLRGIQEHHAMRAEPEVL